MKVIYHVKHLNRILYKNIIHFVYNDDDRQYDLA